MSEAFKRLGESRSEANKSFYKDDEVATQILDIIREAEKHVVLVTPYLKLWDHVKQALTLAKKKNVEVTAILRSNADPTPLGNEDVLWLLNNGFRVLVAENLHAKIFLNEKKLVVTSMNLHESSMRNSLEIALVIQDEPVKQHIRAYVNGTLIRLAQPLLLAQPSRLIQTNTPAPTTTKHKQPSSQTTAGTCIRCGGAVPRDPGRPLCKDCYDKWAEWQNWDYPENHCHLCGKPANTSYKSPLCRDCTSQPRSPTQPQTPTLQDILRKFLR